jgi:pyruvate/2-oxoglutarate dehydrogenase complex dihydrolipoamide dehydrogenase (E3) component
MTEPDLLILGGGTAGLTAAVLAAGLGARATLIERDRTGGDCLWTGCVPSKGLLEAAHVAHAMRTADRLGLDPVEQPVDLARVLKRVRDVQHTIEPHDSPERLRDLGVEVVADDAVFTAPRSVRLKESGRMLAPRAVLIATGSEPVIPPIEGLAEAAPLTTDTVWGLETLPARLVILGAGPIGCELGQAFSRLGSSVTLIEMDARVLPREDPEVGELIAGRLRDEGVDVRTDAKAIRVERTGDGWRMITAEAHGTGTVAFDQIIVATGRAPRTQNLGLDAAGVTTNRSGHVLTNRRLQTAARGVYAAGDVNGHLPFTHVAAYQAGIATFNALLLTRRPVTYRAVPWVTFTDPEVARVGLSEEQARRLWGDKTVIARSDYHEVDRALTAARGEGFAKLVGDPRGRLVGATVAAPAAGEVIAEFAAIIARRGKVGDVYRTVHPYPTYALGAAMAGAERLREQWLNDRTRKVTRPLLSALRRASAVSR